MMKILFVLLGAFVLLTAGCFGQSEEPESHEEVVADDSSDQNNDDQESEASDNPIVEGSEPGSQILEVGDSAGNAAAGSQEDCATLTPTCESCTSKTGCGWCKSSNSCFYGDSDGPHVSSCQNAEWATTPEQCKAPVGGSACNEKTNCADCLSGSGCKFCIEGALCADASSNAECLGGWQNEIYRCNYASR